MHAILQKLTGGDRRSIGKANEVVAEVLATPALFREVISGMLAGDSLVRMRAADAVEKITASHPEYLAPHRRTLIGPVARIDQKEVRWHVAQLLPRVAWNTAERKQVISLLEGYLHDNSSIVKTFAMQALADLSRRSPELRPIVLRRLRELTVSGTPAMRARGRKILAEFRGPQQNTKRSSGKDKVRG
jgi:hypothetical protein